LGRLPGLLEDRPGLRFLSFRQIQLLHHAMTRHGSAGNVGIPWRGRFHGHRLRAYEAGGKCASGCKSDPVLFHIGAPLLYFRI
jgi:hypothetical protein